MSKKAVNTATDIVGVSSLSNNYFRCKYIYTGTPKEIRNEMKTVF